MDHEKVGMMSVGDPLKEGFIIVVAMMTE